MKLYLVINAAAIEQPDGSTDALRYLTPAGRKAFRKTAKVLKERNLTPDIICTSPLTRSVQTAEILAENLRFGGPLIIAEELAPGMDLKAFRQLIEQAKKAKEVILVGHEPDMSKLLAELLDIPPQFSLKKGSVVSLRYDLQQYDEPALFKWLAVGTKITPSRSKAFSDD